MEVTQETYNQIVNDVKNCLHTLRAMSKLEKSIHNCPVKDINKLFNFTYYIYHSSEQKGTEPLSMYQNQYTMIESELKKFPGLITLEAVNTESWKFYFTFYSKNDDEMQDMIDKCVARYYLNPKIQHFAEVILEIVNHYFKIKKEKRGLFYFKIPKHAEMMGRSDKIVLYMSSGDIENFMAAKSTALSKKGWLNPATPLFTKRIADGVATSATPSEELLSHIPKSWQKMFKKEFDSTSYGHYITLAILGSLQTLLIGKGIRKENDPLALDEIPDRQYNELIDEIAQNFVAPKAVRTMTGMSYKEWAG
ncbi:hypothetical protein GF343_04535 [Candidatus Woesearchaeota archaeon]|nr:hypothetical protein [Candidatus Woesearchaeota archaeon]